MKGMERIGYGITITAFIFFIATMVSVKYPLNNDYVPNFFVSLTIQLILSIIAIVAMKKYLTCPIALPAANTLLKPIIAALAATIVINGLMTFATKMAGDKIEVPEALLKLKPIQVFIFVFIYAPIAEELLYRGFLMNLLKPLQQKNILIFKRAISLPVMVSAIAFGAAHLILITTGVSALFLIRIILFTTSLGILAGYYQEKHNNHVYAIIVHMTGNSLAVIASLAN